MHGTSSSAEAEVAMAEIGNMENAQAWFHMCEVEQHVEAAQNFFLLEGVIHAAATGFSRRKTGVVEFPPKFSQDVWRSQQSIIHEINSFCVAEQNPLWCNLYQIMICTLLESFLCDIVPPEVVLYFAPSSKKDEYYYQQQRMHEHSLSKVWNNLVPCPSKVK